MTTLRNAIVAGDGRLHATAEWRVGGLTLCRQVAAAIASQAVRPGYVQPVVTCEDCRNSLVRVGAPASGRRALATA